MGTLALGGRTCLGVYKPRADEGLWGHWEGEDVQVWVTIGRGGLMGTRVLGALIFAYNPLFQYQCYNPTTLSYRIYGCVPAPECT